MYQTKKTERKMMSQIFHKILRLQKKRKREKKNNRKIEKKKKRKKEEKNHFFSFEINSKNLKN